MKRISLLLTILLLSQSIFAQTQQITSESPLSKEMIKVPDSPSLLVFTAQWCTPCQKMRSNIFPQESVAALLKQYNVLFLDVDTKDGYKISQYYCSMAVVPYYVILDKDLKVVTEQVGASDAGTFCAFLEKGLKNESSVKEVTSQADLDIISGGNYHDAIRLTSDNMVSTWSLNAEVGANYSSKPGFSAGVFARSSSKHTDFEMGVNFTGNEFKYIGVPFDLYFKLFKGAKIGFGIVPQYRLAAYNCRNFDLTGRANIAYDISIFTVKAGYNLGFVNQNKESIFREDSIRNNFFSISLAVILL